MKLSDLINNFWWHISHFHIPAAMSALAKESLKTNVAVRTLAVTKGYVTEAEADKLLDPYTMTGKRLEKSSCYNYKKAATLGI